jgi:hypothetical protein
MPVRACERAPAPRSVADAGSSHSLRQPHDALIGAPHLHHPTRTQARWGPWAFWLFRNATYLNLSPTREAHPTL